MPSKYGSAVSIWFSDEERTRLEEAVALTGYKHLSTYIKDKLFDRGDFGHRGQGTQALSQVLSQSVTDEIATRLDLVNEDLAVQKVLLMALTYLAAQELSGTRKLELIRRLSGCRSEVDVWAALGELGNSLQTLASRVQ